MGMDLLFLVLASSSGNGGVVFERVTPPGNGNCLGVVQETIQAKCDRGCRARSGYMLTWTTALVVLPQAMP